MARLTTRLPRKMNLPSPIKASDPSEFNDKTAAPLSRARVLDIARSSAPEALVKKAVTLLESTERSEPGQP